MTDKLYLYEFATYSNFDKIRNIEISLVESFGTNLELYSKVLENAKSLEYLTF